MPLDVYASLLFYPGHKVSPKASLDFSGGETNATSLVRVAAESQAEATDEGREDMVKHWGNQSVAVYPVHVEQGT